MDTIRCRYCVGKDEFRVLASRDDHFVCIHCGHTMIPSDPDYQCRCKNCRKLKRPIEIPARWEINE